VAYLFDQQDAFEEIEELRLELAQIKEQLKSQAAPAMREAAAGPAPVTFQLMIAEVSDHHYAEVAKALSLDHPADRQQPLEVTLKTLAERKLVRLMSVPAITTVEGCVADFSFASAPAQQIEINLLPKVVREGEAIQTQLRYREARVENATRRSGEIEAPLELECGQMAVLASATGKLIFVTANLPSQVQVGRLPAARR